MPQSTNINKNPYYDDFSDSKNFYKVLFKPGVTVQTRELTTLQSILQNQVEKLGSAFFKKNSVVVPGGFAYDSSFYAVEVENNFKGVDVEDYFDSLIGLTLTGKISNVTAKVEKVLPRAESVRSNTTLYIKYQSSSSANFTSGVFVDGEELVVNENIDLNDQSILSGTSVVKTISPINRSSTSIGSAAKIDNGIYFVRGFFVNVSKHVLILDQYNNTPSYRVGLNIDEQIIDASEDASLYDNAQGFSNYAAPGADRLKISLSLTAKNLDDFRDENFIELFRVENGNLIQIKNQTESSYITDILARRTFDESGNYYVSPFNVDSLESLNDNLGNGGLYTKDEDVITSIVPSEENAVIKVSPGKAYVKGYEVPTNINLLNFPKPRTTKHVESSASAFSVGNLLRVNNVSNLPNIGLTTNYTVSLYSGRLSGGSSSGTEIGVARIYDFSSNLTSYQNKSSQFNLNLFDIQTYGKIVSDSSLVSINVGDYIKGNSSGSTGFIQASSGQTLTLRQVSGIFIKNETLSINGISSTTSIGTFTNYSVDDIKSISNGTFLSDSVLSNQTEISGPFTLTVDAGIGTISSNNGSSFASSLKVDNIIKFSQAGVGSDIYAKVSKISINKNSVTLNQVDTVENVCSGSLGVSTSLQSIFLIKPEIFQSDDPSLTAQLNHSNIANVDFLNSNIYVKVSYTGVTKSSTTLTLPTLSGDYVYSSYDSERYVVVNADGSIENLDSATKTLSNGGKDLQFTGLSAASGPCKVITTQIKSNVSQKFKKLVRCNSLSISKTKYSTPQNAGLSYSSVYGRRVEDDQISLNTSDILLVQGIFESSTTSDPVLPWIAFTNLNSLNGVSDDLIIGELVIGATSGAVAVYAEKKDTNQLYLIYKNNNRFLVGETISFSESEYTSDVTVVTIGDKNILDDFVLDNGQRSYFYDFGRLIRKSEAKEPAGRLKIYFDNFTYNANDYGDLISANSYPSTLQKNSIPFYNGIRNSDVIDIRPKVVDYNTSSTVSPFDFGSRIFTSSSNNPIQILSPYENFIFDYDFYLPRTDKLTLSKDGIFSIVFGDPSETPIAPSISNEVLDVSTIISSPYVYDIKRDIKIVLTDNRRYTMSDLRDIENRVSNLEYYTSLSLLELSTQSLLITDANGLNRFKSGFFVDEFKDDTTSEIDNINYNASIENGTLSSIKQEERIDLSLFSTGLIEPITDTNLSNTTSNNLKVTGNTISLNYSEVVSTKQPFASKVVNVNPFNITTWSGFLGLSPEKDTWSIVLNRSVSVANAARRNQTRVVTRTQKINQIRSRNIDFTAVKLKPNTQFKVLLDKKDLSSNTLKSFAFPKLLEISNNVGSFEIGETVKCLDNAGKIICKFRLCSPNHKSGPINSPTLIYSKNPYSPAVGISTQYGPQSTFLNIDTATLSRKEISEFWGKIYSGNKLVGLTSKASAVVSNIRFITNEEGSVLGNIWIDEKDNFKSGQATVDLILQNPLPKVPGEVSDSSASAVFTSEGSKITNTTIKYYDPLAQTFLVEDENGIIPTSVDVYFYTKDKTLPVELQIREVSFGTPGGPDKVVPGLKKTLSSSQVGISSDANVKTTFTFDTLSRLSPGEYSVVLLSDSVEYQVWVSELGAEDISTANLSAVNKVFINKQPSLGTLFKSQNGTTWVPSPLEDLKFTLNKASFSTTGGTARFYNSSAVIFSEENRLPANLITAISTSGSYPNNGRHILVFHPNHGMYGPNNLVEISGIESDVLPEKLSVSYASTDVGAITVDSNSIFQNFEGSSVNVSNPGYIQIADEIIKYEGISGGNQLINITRGMYGTIPLNHSIGDPVYKYEFNNVSLARINTQLTVLDTPKQTLDSYYVQVSAGSSFTQTKTGGGDNAYALRNKQFSELKFNPDLVTNFNGTNTSASVRTISATSVAGNETSFLDKGFESVGINSVNKFDSPRMVSSRINETTYLNSTNFAGNKSFTLQLNLSTEDANVSPLINLNQTYVTGAIYNINQPVGISSYAVDNRVNSNTNDPHSFVHITNRINLQESANSLQVLFSAYKNPSSDIRVLYKIFTNDAPDDEQVWQLFPGYDNLDVNGNIISIANNNGKSDIKVRDSLNDEFLDYKYSIDNLQAFNGFQIKIVGTSTNQAYSPLIRDLRVIALKWWRIMQKLKDIKILLEI